MEKNKQKELIFWKRMFWTVIVIAGILGIIVFFEVPREDICIGCNGVEIVDLELEGNQTNEIKWSNEIPEVWYYLSEDYRNITINEEACKVVPCSCHEWGCALMCYYCEDKLSEAKEE